MIDQHQRAEILAGAIALEEATDEERIEYRRHLAQCDRCLQTLGGEHRLAGIRGLIRRARESEIWEPDVTGPLISRLGATPHRLIRYGLGFLTLCLFISLVAHLVIGSELAQMRPTLEDPLTISYEGNRIVLERRSLRDQKPTFKPRPQVVVDHNVVRAVVRPAVPVVAQRPAEAAYRHRGMRPSSKVAAKELTVVTTQNDQDASAAQPQVTAPVAGKEPAAAGAGSAPESGAVPAPARAQSTERIAFAPSYVTREAAPEGGDTAINPKYNELAYEERAEGTVSYEVTVDAQGNPTNVAIVKSSGFLVLDKAVRDAAMSVRYKPALLNGKPVAGVYRDAITFHAAATSE